RKKVVLHEIAENATDAILLRLHDGRVRDGNAERMSKEGSDSKPVREPADECRLCRRTDVCEPWMFGLEQVRDDEDDERQDEQPGGDELHASQGDTAGGLVEGSGVGGGHDGKAKSLELGAVSYRLSVAPSPQLQAPNPSPVCIILTSTKGQ